MTSKRISWDDFKLQASNDLLADGAYIYRGQRDALWTLTSTLHRTTIVRAIHELRFYVDSILPKVHEAIEAWNGRRWNLADPKGLPEFLAYLQHNGFPTPLLDWTRSPYIAAYFAYESINYFNPQSNYVAIYRFNAQSWRRSFPQCDNVRDLTPHVSLLTPRMIGNHKLALQQGCFTWSTVVDTEGHIRERESENLEFLTKYELDTAERSRVMRELALMGISAIQLVPSVESVCKKALEDLIGLKPVEPRK